MTLREVVDKYLALSSGFGQPVELAKFGLDRAETERIFSVFDEDYHISRYFHLSRISGETFEINGFPHTHVVIDPEVQSIL